MNPTSRLEVAHRYPLIASKLVELTVGGAEINLAIDSDGRVLISKGGFWLNEKILTQILKDADE